MAILQIDTGLAQTSKYFDQLTQLEGVEYLFTFLWSDREGCWYVELGDQDGNPIASGVRLVLGASLLRRFTDTRLPPGLLTLVDYTGTGFDLASPGDLGVGYQLMYLTSDDPILAG